MECALSAHGAGSPLGRGEGVGWFLEGCDPLLTLLRADAPCTDRIFFSLSSDKVGGEKSLERNG